MVLNYFESLFLTKYPLDDELVYQWFITAIGEFELEIHDLKYNPQLKEFNSELPIFIQRVLGLMMLEQYQLRNTLRLESLNGIQSKDLSITGTDASKRVARLNLEDTRYEISKLLFKLKNNSFQN